VANAPSLQRRGKLQQCRRYSENSSIATNSEAELGVAA